MLFSVIDILFYCTPRIFTDETMVHHDRARSLLLLARLINRQDVVFCVE